MPEAIALSVDGRPVTVPAESMVSTAVLVSGAKWFRKSVTGERRGPLCGMGICFECRVTIDGESHSRSCQVPCRDGMDVRTESTEYRVRPTGTVRSSATCDVLVVGAGPAGLAAACSAAQSGARVTIVDDNPGPGGQIWRGEERAHGTQEAVDWFKRARTAKIEFIYGAKVFDQPETGLLLTESTAGVTEIGYKKLILATGARELFLPFPGWSLPNVCGAGGLQALVKSGLPIKGKRVVVAGTGPLLLAVADYLRKHGAEVCLIAEQASWRRLVPFGWGLLRSTGKATQAIRLRQRLSRVNYLTGCWPVAAEGDGELSAVTMRQGSKSWSVACDYLACGFHLVPNLEVAGLVGCEVIDNTVRVDEFQETSVADVYCAGEATGIGGLELSLLEGQIAGYAAMDKPDLARQHFLARTRLRRFAALLNRTFALRDELKRLARPETFVCRCEDVTLERLQTQPGWRAAKLHTRCGMGPCQGRICGPATEFLFDWRVESVRPPVFPVRVDSLTHRDVA